MLNANFIKIGLICVLGLAACGEERSEDPAAQTMQPTIEETLAKGVGPDMIGTFMSDSRRPGDLTQLVLKTNNTFHSATTVECFAPPCDPVQDDGMYKLYWRDSRRFIALYNRAEIIARYQYEWRDNALYLLRVSANTEAAPNAAWLPMWLSNTAWCANPTLTPSAPTASAPNDCQLQNLPIGPCAGEWMCVSNTCNWDCAAQR